MAQPTTDTINNLTTCLRMPGFFPGGYIDQFLRTIPFQAVDGYGRQVEINRATSLGDAPMYSPGDSMAAAQGVTALSTFTFERIGGTAIVDEADIVASQDPNDQLEIQVAMRRVALLRELGEQIVIGDGTPPNLAGLSEYVSVAGGNAVDLAGAAPTLKDFHRLVALVRASDGFVGGGADALVMNSQARRFLLFLIESSAGCASCCFEPDPALGVPVVKFDGLPVYVTDAIPTVGENETTMFAAKLTGPTGIRVLHSGGSSEEFGVVVDSQPVQLSINQRAKAVRGYYALMVPEVLSVGALLNADITGCVP